MTLTSNPSMNISNPSMNIVVGLLVPVVSAVVGAVGILIRDLYDRRSEMGRRKYAMDEATRQVTFAAEWWKAKQALGSTPDDEAARAIAESWLEEATSLVSTALHPPRRPEPSRSVTRQSRIRSRILLAYPFQRWTARVLRVAYYVVLVFTALGVLAAPLLASEGAKLGDVAFTFVVEVGFYGLLALGIRAWAVSIENRAAKQRTSAIENRAAKQGASAQPFVPTGELIAPRPGWYPDPSGVPGQRYWDGQRWTEVTPGST
jgi:hypothetical protein